MKLTKAELTPTGIYEDFPEYAYHAEPSLSSSQLKEFMRSPKHFKFGATPDSAVFRFGRAAHGMAFDPDIFFRDNLVVDASTRNTKIYKEAAAKAGPGQTVYLQHEIAAATEVAVAARTDDVACDYFDKTKFETSFFWEEQGMHCRARTDMWQPQYNRVCDLKTVQDASPEAFTRAVFNYKWHISAAWYRRGMESCGQTVDEWLWIAVEKTAPYAVQVYRPDPSILDLADAEIDQALRYLAECDSADRWPSYADGVFNLALPAWAGINL